jgi:amidohydrolase
MQWPSPDKNLGSRSEIVQDFRPDLEPYRQLYKKLHQNPELAGEEYETASTIKLHLEGLGITKVISEVGGTGVVGILENGHHPVVLLRAEMDALAMEEHTGLSYSSRKKGGSNRQTTPVFHGCGHDMHMSCLLAAADLLSKAKAKWHGTVIFLFQPSEEDLRGARAMVQGGLSKMIPRPTVLLAQHSTPRKAGAVSIRSGSTLTAIERFEVRINGRGGHGANPAACKDPIVAGAHIISQLQTIVSREVRPSEFAVLSCPQFTAGYRGSSVIPDYADLTITLRSFDPKVVGMVYNSARRIIEAGCTAAGMPKGPDFYGRVSAPALVNDASTVRSLQDTFAAYFGESLFEASKSAASEDFPVLAEPFDAPYGYWYLGCIGSERWDEAEKQGKLGEIPGNHSSGFYPDIDPTLQTGTDAMALAALTFLQVKDDASEI